MKLRLRRPLAMLLTVVMLLGLLPTAAFAVEGEESGEPVTASAPKDITLEDAACEVGGEVALNGTATVLDGGTLSYQWYQSSDDTVDDADATEDEKNDTLLENQTDATLTVNTTEAGTFYYYVVATNTVTLADGTTTTASTTSNVATVTVTAGEPVPPSGSNEPEDGQEPPANSTPENEQTPGNDNADGEPGNTDPNGDPNGGEPEQGPVEPGDGKASDAKITSLLLKDFTPFGGSGSGNLNLLKQEGPVQWDLFSPYTLEVGVSVPAGSSENKVTITLPEGMKFVGLEPNQFTGLGIDSAAWVKNSAIYGYQPDNGTLTVSLASGASSATISVSVQPDGAFFPPEKREEGLLIENAIQVQVNDDAGEKSTVAVDVDVKTSLDSRVPYIGDGNVNSNMNTAAGGTVTLEGHVYTGWLSESESISSRLINQLSFSLEVPENFTVENVSGANVQWSITKGDTADGKTIWKFSTTEGLYGTSRVGRISITAPANAQEGTYPITVKEVSAQTYGQNEPMTKTYQNTTLWTVAVKSPDTVEVQVEGENFSNVLNYTAIGNEEGTFDDYNSLLTAAVVTNEGLQAVKQSLIYEAEFDQVSQFITAVGIPCGWGKEGYMPTSITVTYEGGTSTTLTENEIETVAALATDGYGFVLRGKDIPGYQENSIAKIKVELPGLPQNYKSSASPYFGEGNAYNTGRAYAGAWGRVRDGVGGEPDATNKYCIYLADGGVPAFTEIKTTYKNQSRISDEAITATLTVGGTAAATVNSGGLIHVSAPIRPSGYINQFRSYEASLLDPVIYLLEPEDLSIENVKITTNTGAELTYRRTEITGQHTNLPNGYKLYEYTLADKLMLGWWDADWNSTTLNLEFDYRVDTAAQTRSYDLQDLILFKSSLNLPFARYGVQDTYNLNGENDIGTVKSKTFTVQAATDFNIATTIQIEGENKWYSYDPENPASTTSVFTEGATANVRVTVTNNSGETANNTVVYIPVPKKGQASMLGEHFIRQAGFDMFIADKADLTGASGWDVQYGQVTKVKLGDNGVPTGEFELNGNWSNEYNTSTNMIKLTLSSGMANGTSAEIILKFKATEETGQTDSMNIFKSWYKYATEKASIVDTEKVYNFGTLLQNGKLNGTVYVDTNRNGVKDVGENGIAGVTVKVTDSEGRTYETQTGEGGAYSFNSLPGSKELTLTVTNPSSPDPNNSGGSYRFHGGDVTPAEDNRSARKSGFTLEGGTATVNAGLIEPYTVTFLVAGGEGTTSFVNPSSRKIYAGQTLGEVTERVTVSLAPGLEFENKWNKMPTAGVESIEVQHSDLLKQTVTADTTFTAVTTSTKNTVTAMWWNTQTSSITQQFEQIVDWSRPVGDSFPADGTVNNRPGYNFTGWSVNGTSTIKQRGEIINAPVTGAVNYIAQYTEKADITVTLNANGGTFGGEQTTVTKTGQKYGTGVDYDTPTREGYTFLGWATTSTATEGSMSLTCPATDTEFYAVWKPGTVRLTLLENGGTWTDGSTYKNGYIDGTVGEVVTLPTASDITREGYDFLGWYVQGNTEQKVLSNYAFPTKDTILIAKWEPKQERITFDYGEESGIKAETVSGPHGSIVGYEKGQELTTDKTYAGFTLTGWTALDGTVIPAANTGSIVIEQGATYTAIWAQNQTSLVFDAGSSANFPNNGQTKTYYGSAGEALPHGDLIDPVMTGKTFEGWYTQKTGGEKVDTFTFPNAGSITYYAHWKDAEYTVTFNYNGGKVDDATSSTVKVTHGQMVETVPVPTLIGSTLQGWQNLTTSETMTADQINEAPVTADVIYNAVWSGNSYTVTFSNYDGDPNSKATVTVTEGAAPVAPVVKAPEGQVFLHWKDNASDNTYTAEALTKLQVKADMNFTAVFGEDSYTITFITSNGSFENMDGATQTTITKQGGQTLAEDDFPSVTGNTANFTGWYCNGTTKSAEQWAGTPVNGSMTFVAAFEGKVTVSFNTMGGKWTDDGQQYANGIEGNAGDTMALPTAEHITRTGYTFTGWYTDMDCKTKAPDKFPGSRTTYYAGWSTEGLSVTVTDTPTYDGTAQEPALTVMSGSTTLTSGQYVPSWSNNTNAGTDTASVTVYGLGEYTGLSGTATFTINKANQTVTFAKPGEQTATYGETFANTATAKLDSTNATISYSSSNDNIATVDESTGKVTIHKAGEVTITATAAATGNVNADKAEYKLTIDKANPTLTFANSTVGVKTTGSVSNQLTTKPDGLTVTYSSKNPSVATVDENGNVTLVGEGTATITATFEGNDCYNEAETSYTLTVDNDAIAYTAEDWYGIYDGTPHGITVNVTTLDTGAKVTYSTTKDGTYTTDAPTYTDAGTYTVYYKIEAQGYDTVTGSAEVVISQAMLTDATVANSEYTGQPVEGTVSEVKAGTLTVPAASYEVSYVSNVDAGTAVAIITAKANSNFVGTVPETFTITPKQLTSQMVSAIADQPYTGDQITPTVIVTDGTTPLVKGRDFTVIYGNNNEVGTGKGTVTITGTGNYTGKVPKTFNITNSGTFEVIVDNSTLTYDGTEKTPAVTVWAVSDDGNTKTLLTVDNDYTVTYASNVNAGTASVTITGKGAYAESGGSWKSTMVYFTIQPAEQSVTFAGVTDGKLEKTYGDSAFEQAATVTLNPEVSGQTPGAVTYTSSDPTVATVDSTGKVTIVGAGTATITASAAATQNYKGAEASYTLTVKPKDINSEDVTASKIPDQPYGGVPVTPDFSLTDSDPDITKHNLEVNVDYTFTYSNNDGEGTGKITITGAGNYTGTKEVTFKIIPWSDSQVVVTPAAITIYMGGADGYEGVVVDEDTGSITASSSLPEPGFLFTLPEMLKDALAADHADLTDITFREPASGKEWTAELYADGASTVYRLVPSGAQEPVRVQFTNAQGQTVTEDKFEVGENINQTLTMTLYKGDVGVIYAIYDGVQYPIRLGKSTLTVRGVTEEAQYAAVTDGTEAPVEGKPAVTAESGTTYTINGSKVQVEDPSGVALLYDSIIDANGEDRTSLLEDKAGDTLASMGRTPGEGSRFAYSFQYLDLVDQNNGNAWVKASQDVTIYWPSPAGTDKNTEFTLLHFEGLHRSMDADNIAGQIEGCTVSEVTIVNKTETHIVLKAGSQGFSPFALVWEEKIPTYTITATSNGNGSITPDGVTTVQEGGSQSYTIQADSGYHISDVKVNGTSVGAVESYDFTDVRSNQTIEAIFARNSSGGGGGGGGGSTTIHYIIEAEAGRGGDISPDGRVSVSRGSDKTFRITADEGYEIADVIVDGKSVGAVSSYTFENVRKNHTISVTFQEAEQVADPDDTGVSGWLNTKDHIQYLSGYGGGKFGPSDNMTRAQAAQMFYNLLLDKNVPITVSFTDVAADAWYAKAVNTLASLGIVDGIGDNHYAPERAITRAEFTVIAMRFAKLDTSGKNIFSDVTADAWYYDYVVGSIQYGWINGYEDGTFRPNNTITRSEVTAIVNRMLGRSADKAFVDRHADELTQFSDVPVSYWAYYEIMEAANAHDYVKDNGVEDWTRLQ